MNTIKIIQSEKAITSNDIAEFEAQMDLHLPENYKNLILKYNGGIDSIGDSLVTELYSIKYGELQVKDVINDLQILEKNIPREYLPIAVTSSGNQITINLKSGNDFGKIYLFRFDKLEPDKVADSLEDLFGVNSIKEL